MRPDCACPKAAQLRIPDIGSQRMQLNIASGKGNKQRLVPLSPRLLTALRTYWKEYRPTDYLFPGQDARSALRADFDSERRSRRAPRAKIQKNVTPHVLRHSYATGLLEAGVDILTISRCSVTRASPPRWSICTYDVRTGANAQSTGLVADTAVAEVGRAEDQRPATTTRQVNRCSDSEEHGRTIRRALSTTSRATSPKHVGQAVALSHGGFRRTALPMQRMWAGIGRLPFVW